MWLELAGSGGMVAGDELVVFDDIKGLGVTPVIQVRGGLPYSPDIHTDRDKSGIELILSQSCQNLPSR